MAIVLVKSYHWIGDVKCAQVTCWNCHVAMGVVRMPELQTMTCQPGLPIVCFVCREKREALLEAQQLTLVEIPPVPQYH